MKIRQRKKISRLLLMMCVVFVKLKLLINLEKYKSSYTAILINIVFDAESTALDDSRIKW